MTLSCGLYQYYWYWKNWAVIKNQTEEKKSISPTLRTIFIFFWITPLFRKIKKDLSIDHRLTSFFPFKITTFIIIYYFIYIIDFLSELGMFWSVTFIILFLISLLMLPLIQGDINKSYGERIKEIKVRKLTIIDTVFMMLGMLAFYGNYFL